MLNMPFDLGYASRVEECPDENQQKRVLSHSEGITYKSQSDEVAMCPRVGRMGPVKR